MAEKKETISMIAVLINLVLSAAKIAVGILSRSASVIAEGIHSGMDIITSVISFFGIKLAKKPVDKKHPYGHYKSEVIAGFLITIVLFLTSLWIIYGGITDFFTVKEIQVTYLTLGVMAASAVINELMARIKIHYGKNYESMALIADGQHSRIDVFVSAGVFAGLFLVRYWAHIDSLIAIAIGVYILIRSFFLGRETTDSLLDVTAGEEFEEKVRKLVEKEGIRLSGIRTQKLGPKVFAELKVELDPKLKVDQASKITKKLQQKLTGSLPELQYTVIQISTHDIKEEYYKPPIGEGFTWRGRMGGKALGPRGQCVCAECGKAAPHKRGVPCTSMKCPECGSRMKRENNS
ncbi:cation diffusion facilitator family transporter [Candidatus Woesearchaeota archaeon]|nr:cation diffusion facilitator family transporter [Candidatus Woesearchaeota archaeon]